MADSDPNVGIGTPIASGPATGTSVAQPIPYTLLSLPRYARIMGINPVHFAGAVGTSVWTTNTGCSNVWPRYSWQDADKVAHYELALEIKQAEDDIAAYLGYFPAPRWTSAEMHKYPKFHRHDYMDGGGRQFASTPYRKSIVAKNKKVISGGRRAVTLLATPTVAAASLVYSDNDGDGFYETATVTVTTTVTEESEIKVYHAGHSGAQEWEIRPAVSKSVSGGVATLVFESWLFIDPDELSAPPTLDGFSAVSMDTISSLVTSVDVYREYNSEAAVASQMFWEPSNCSICTNCSLTIQGSILLPTGSSAASATSCPECGYTAQDGCLLVRDVDTGIVVPAPATWDSDNDTYVITDYAVGRDPDIVKLWYRSGEISEERLRGDPQDMLSYQWAKTIAYLATSRLERPPCDCSPTTTLSIRLMKDIAFTGGDSSFLVDFDILSNPF